MKSEQLFLTDLNRTVKQAMRQLNDLGEKELFVINDQKHLCGALSDGDIRKWILKGGSLDAPVSQVCNHSPKSVSLDYDLEEVKATMLDLKIECIPVIDEEKHVVRILTWDEVFAGKVEKTRAKLNVPVVIMAGGKGSRMDPFTRVLPKSLIPIGDKPVIELIMDKFNEYAIRNFIISVNYKARLIKSYFEEASGKYSISYIEEETPLGTAGSLKLLEGKISSPFIVSNCDVILDCDYSQLLHFHQEHNNDLTLVVTCRHYVIPYGVCELNSDGALKDIKEKPELDLLINTGMYVINGKILSLIPQNMPFHFNELILAAKAKGYRVGVFPINEKCWHDVGQWEEYNKTMRNFDGQNQVMGN